MKVGQMIASAILLSAFSDSLKSSRFYRPVSKTAMHNRRLTPHDHIYEKLMDVAPNNFAVNKAKNVLLSCLITVFLFGSAVPSTIASTLGSKVDIGETVSCENIKLDHLVKVGAGGGGTVFSAVRQGLHQTIADNENAAKVVVKVSWATSANSVHHECEVLRYLEKYNVKGVERCIASGVYVQPDEGHLLSVTAALPLDSESAFFPSEAAFKSASTDLDTSKKQSSAVIDQPRKSVTYLASLYELDEEQENKKKESSRSTLISEKTLQEGERAMIVLDPYFKATRPAKSTLLDISEYSVKVKAVHNLIGTMMDMLWAGSAGSDLQPLLDVDTGDSLLIDMTEAEIFSNRKKLNFEDQQIAGSFIGEMFSLIAADRGNSDGLMAEARRTVKDKTGYMHALGDDMPASILSILDTYVE